MAARGLRYAWYGSTVGGYLFLPFVGAVFITTGHPWHAALCFSVFTAGIAYLVTVTPWRYPDIGFGKLLLPMIVPLVLLCLVLAVTRPEHQGESVSAWQALSLIPLLVMPVILTWKRTGRESLEGGARPPGKPSSGRQAGL
jgi:MFS superfamily sulfate permease-like transporter